MGGYTKNLQLYKADTSEDGNDTFNINRMLNDNWDKIDEMLKKLPVQNGGLYINEETTEEDKAEAKDILRNHLGMFPMYFHHNNETDLLDISLQSGVHKCTNWKNHPEGDKDSQGIALIFSYLTTINQSWRIVIYYSANNYDRIAYNACVTDVLNNTIIWTGWRKFGGEGDYLPVDGSVPMSGYSLGLLNNKLKIQASSNGSIQLDAYDTANDENNRRTLILYSKNAVDDLNKALRLVKIVDGAATYYNIFGEHNKPSGSYTGNGSSTTRTINIGGVGNILYISSPYGFGFVTADGGFFVQASYDTTAYVVSYSSSYIKFVDGVLTIESSSSYINSSSYTYTYRVL